MPLLVGGKYPERVSVNGLVCLFAYSVLRAHK